ncbi:MAG: MATE family efflux transporter [Ilumatobacteraceae bacterium]
MAFPGDTDRRILRLAIPALGALAVEPLYVAVDTAMIGRVGTSELAGLALAAAVLSLLVAGANFLTYGTTQQVARAVGANDPASADRAGRTAMWVALAVGVSALPILVLVRGPLVGFLGGTGTSADHASTYLWISALGLPAVMLVLASQGVFRGHSDYRTPLWILLASNMANAVIEWFLVFPRSLGRWVGVVDRYRTVGGRDRASRTSTAADRPTSRQTAWPRGGGSPPYGWASPAAPSRGAFGSAHRIHLPHGAPIRRRTCRASGRHGDVHPARAHS